MAFTNVGQKKQNQCLLNSIEDGDFQSATEHIKNGADINFNDGQLISESIIKENIDAIKFLIENKAKLNTTYIHSKPLEFAVKMSPKEIVELLVENGADIQVNGNSPIAYAAEKKDFEMVKYLHQQGASIDDDYHHIIRDFSEHSLEAFKYCFDNASEIKNKDLLVNHVVEHGRTDCLAYLIEKGLSMNGVQKNGEYPLYVAAISGQADKIDLLVANGVEPNDKKALLGAVNNGHLDAVKTLINHGAATDHSTLYQATIWGQPEIVDFLLIEKKIPITEETRIWLNEQKGVSKDVAYTALLLEKRDLNEKLETKLQPKIQKKQMTMKL